MTDNNENKSSARKIGETTKDNIEKNDINYISKDAPSLVGFNDKVDEKTKKQKNGMNKGGKIAMIAVLCVAIAVGGYFAYDYFFADTSFADSGDEVILDTGKFFQGLNVLGIDLGNKTAQDVRSEVEANATDAVANTAFTYTVNEKDYVLSPQELGAAINIDEVFNDAMLYGRQGDYSQRKAQINEAATKGFTIEAPIVYNADTILAALKANDTNLNVAPIEAEIKMNKISDEEKLISKMEIDYTDSVVGQTVDLNALSQEIVNALSNNENSIQVQAEILEPTITTENIKDKYSIIGTFKTTYKDSKDGRRYNIWKMGDVINGVKIEPGETWSINEEAGPRTFKTGWKGAPGISNGVYKEEAGGGICQTSSTLYNAILRSEVTIVERSHHSWPLTYVAPGLDATISTGAPDFKIKNDYDVPIYIIVDCEGEDQRYVDISVLGPPFEDGLTREFSSEVISTFGGSGVREVPDPSLPLGTRNQIQGAHVGKNVQVYKHWLDENGTEVKKEKFYKDTYGDFPAVVHVGTGAPAAPVWEEPAPPPPVAPAPNPVPVPDPVPPAVV